MNYFNWVIKNTNNNEFMVCHREGRTDSLWRIFKTFEEAHSYAKGCNFGNEPIDETKHH